MRPICPLAGTFVVVLTNPAPHESHRIGPYSLGEWFIPA
jgi:hypothetical protein